MREIKFRAWGSFNDKMIGWDDVKHWDFALAESVIYEFMEFIGLQDKNGKDAYHLDYVKTGKKIYSIEWQQEEARFWLAPVNHTGNWLFMDELNRMEIIGNKFQPELVPV